MVFLFVVKQNSIKKREITKLLVTPFYSKFISDAIGDIPYLIRWKKNRYLCYGTNKYRST
jgi:hypothetical protein